MGTEYGGFSNAATERVVSNFGDYLMGFGDWIEGTIESFVEIGMTKADAISCLAGDIEDYFNDTHEGLMNKCNPVECLFIEKTEYLDIDYREVAEAFLRDYKPKKSTAKPKTSKSVKKGRGQSGRTNKSAPRRR